MNIEAIVIRKMAAREHDQLVILYSREAGKLSVAARGSLRLHSTQALALDEANVIHCELVHGKSGPIMTGAQAAHSFSSMKRSSVRWAAAQFFLQATDALIFDEQPDDQLWRCLVDALTNLDQAADSQTLSVFRRYQGCLLEALGYGAQDDARIASATLSRGAMDAQFEAIAQRRLSSLDLFYDVAAR